jgi:hypothetical protein
MVGGLMVSQVLTLFTTPVVLSTVSHNGSVLNVMREMIVRNGTLPKAVNWTDEI